MKAVMRLLLFILLAMAADPRSQVLATESRWVQAIDTRTPVRLPASSRPASFTSPIAANCVAAAPSRHW